MAHANVIQTSLSPAVRKQLEAAATKNGIKPAAQARELIIKGLAANDTLYQSLIDAGLAKNMSEAEDYLAKVRNYFKDNVDELAAIIAMPLEQVH